LNNLVDLVDLVPKLSLGTRLWKLGLGTRLLYEFNVSHEYSKEKVNWGSRNMGEGVKKVSRKNHIYSVIDRQGSIEDQRNKGRRQGNIKKQRGK
jgi:hypothetical protein